jgi:hypothetical protein
MNPNLFNLEWDRLLEVLATVIVLAFLVERALSLLFEHRLYIKHFNQKGFKEPIAFVVSLLVCWFWDFDAIGIVILAEKTSLIGKVITAAIIAGGSKGSIRLFRDILDIRSDAERARSRTIPPQQP